MLKSLEVMLTFTKIEKAIFENDIFEENTSDSVTFLKLLKTLPVPELNEFLSAFPQFYPLDEYRKEVEATCSVSNEEQTILDSELVKIAGRIRQKRVDLEESTIKVKKQIIQRREGLKAEFDNEFIVISDQNADIQVPPVQKDVEDGAHVIQLPEVDSCILTESDIFNCLNNRKSRRSYTEETLLLSELSFLLWATQGIQRKASDNSYSLRTVPSGGARQPFETYLAVHNVKGLKPGIYRYLPFDHKIVFLFAVGGLKEKVNIAAFEQNFVGNCAVTFIWSVIPYRTEWRYTLDSRKIILQDSGHLCQNLYIACEAISCGTCAIGAYDQKLFDELIQLDGVDEFVVYVAPVGKARKSIQVIQLPGHELKKYCGVYWCESQLLKRTILFKEGHLYYWRSAESESRLECIGTDKFNFIEADATLTFSADEENLRMTFQGEGEPVIEFVKVEI